MKNKKALYERIMNKVSKVVENSLNESKVQQVTVKEMYMALGKAIKNGDGDKYLIAANDNEGNGYHGVFYHISTCEQCGVTPSDISDSMIKDVNNLMVIG